VPFRGCKIPDLRSESDKKSSRLAEWLVVVRFKEFHEANEIHTEELLWDSARSMRHIGTFCDHCGGVSSFSAKRKLLVCF
jgi:hypothetical protein